MKTKTYVWSVIVTLAVAGLSALLSMGNMDIYGSIEKPAFAPPSILFPIVWGILYILMGISVANVIIKAREKGVYALSCIRIYALQLIVNFFWSIIFFNLRAFLFSFIWLVLLWVLIIVMIKCFSKISSFAAYINIPYLLWVTFAAALNFMIFRLN
ncbi:MAG: tryptophan-rich sensory protein [Ruminococcaceae bacterium]|nr:tryptophan-rich sensory protein [Oscillospiraceae bacterium]